MGPEFIEKAEKSSPEPNIFQVPDLEANQNFKPLPPDLILPGADELQARLSKSIPENLDKQAGLVGKYGVREQLGLPTNVKQDVYDNALKASGKSEAEIIALRKEELEILGEIMKTLLKDKLAPDGKPYNLDNAARTAQGFLDTQRWWKTDNIVPKGASPVGLIATDSQFIGAFNYAKEQLDKEAIWTAGRNRH